MTPLPPPSGRSAPPSGRAQFFAIFPSIMLPVFLAVVDQTIVATALPGIAGELGHVDRVAWVVIAYLMAVTIASPVYGRLGDMLGRRRLMFVALVVSMTGSVVCALAPNIEVLVAARVVQGLGGGGLLTLTQALIGEAIQARDRARYQGFLAAIAMTSNTFGPVVGGILTQHFGWRSVFLVNLPVGLIAVFLTSRLPARKGTGEAFRFDAPGLMLFTSFAISVLVMLQYLQQVRFEAIPIILALLVLAVVSALLLVWREARAHSPLFPPDVVRNPSVWRCDGLAACHGALLVSLITFSPIYLRVVHGVSIAQAGLLLLPMTVSLAIGSLTTGRIVSRTGHTAILPSWGMVIVACTILLLALVANHLPTLGFAAVFAFTAMFMGTVMAVVQVTVQVSAGPGMLGTAAASVQLSRALGASLGTAIIGATLFIAMRVTDADAARLMAELLQSGPDALLAWPEAGRAALQVEIGDAFRLGFLVMGIFAVMASILAWTLPTRDI